MSCKHDFHDRTMAVEADGYCPLCMADENVELRTEVERLRADNDTMQRCELAARQRVETAYAGVERLRAAMTAIKGGTTPGGRNLNELARDLHLAHDIARRALEQKADTE